jgi:TetR/AcrR family transcriptional repressor of nem operon
MSRKQEIISIARNVIHTKGYQATSVTDILNAANIGKGQFYHYFSSKYDLGLAVVEDLIQEWDGQLINGILKSEEEPESKLNQMLHWATTFHTEMEKKRGCPIGNLAIEMSEHGETFRVKIQQFIDRWFLGVEAVLDEMIKLNKLDPSIDTKKGAQTIVAMIEGGVLVMKNQQDRCL